MFADRPELRTAYSGQSGRRRGAWVYRAVCGWLVLGALLMTATAASVGLGRPFSVTNTSTLHLVYAVLGGWVLVQLALGIGSITDAAGRIRRRDLDGLQRAANAVKSCAIWFFMINFAGCGLLLWGVRRVGRGGSRWELQVVLALVVFVCLTYLVMLATSAYGIAALVLMRRDQMITKAFFGISLVLHLIFLADVLSSVLVVEVARALLGRSRAPKPVEHWLLIAVLGLCSALALAWLVLGLIALATDQNLLYEIVGVLSLASPLALILVVIVPVVPIITVRTAMRLYLRRDLDALRRLTRTVKLAAIPLFVQNFLICAVIVLAATLLPIAASRGMIVLLGPVGVAVIGALSSAALVPTVSGTYLLMLVTSCYGVAAAAVLGRTRAGSRRFVITQIVLHLVFVADIVSSMVLAHRARVVLQQWNRRRLSAERPRQ